MKKKLIFLILQIYIVEILQRFSIGPGTVGTGKMGPVYDGNIS